MMFVVAGGRDRDCTLVLGFRRVMTIHRGCPCSKARDLKGYRLQAKHATCRNALALQHQKMLSDVATAGHGVRAHMWLGRGLCLVYRTKRCCGV